ncbi:MAG: GNAT family N-acetyltransferase [Candidatus Saganbacteria bacterium]|nr:GNAT family N-acetyltransferase [Candidatus Saganbacteria bacterium]
MLKLRKAEEKDKKILLKLLTEEFDFYYDGMPLKDFYLINQENETVGTIQLEEHPDYYFLTSLGVKESYRKQGIASFAMNEVLKGKNKSIYLETLIPNFFKQFGFKVVPCPSFLLPKDPIRCEDCFPDKCVCMVK